MFWHLFCGFEEFIHVSMCLCICVFLFYLVFKEGVKRHGMGLVERYGGSGRNWRRKSKKDQNKLCDFFQLQKCRKEKKE